MAKPIQVDEASFEAEVLRSKEPVLVDFYADWCGPCRALAPIIEELAAELKGRLKVTKLNVDENESLSVKYGVQSIPTLIMFRNGDEVERIVGFLSKSQLLQRLEAHLNG